MSSLCPTLFSSGRIYHLVSPVAAPDPETEPKTKIHEPMRNADGD